jgi:multiple sugar transport system substrate-binding protein
MVELLISVMMPNPAAEQALAELLGQFEAQARLKVSVQNLDWVNARSELNRIAFERSGPDISQAGTTWVGDLQSMDVLRPFSPLEVNEMGGLEQFIPASWTPGKLAGDARLWAAPWLTDVFLIHYRRDLLEAAGLDPQQAFASIAALEETVARLGELGYPAPLAPALSFDIYSMLHVCASFVWNEGGAFVSDDGKQPLFNQPAALRGFSRYLGLLDRYSSQALTTLHEHSAWDLFLGGQAVMAFASQGLASGQRRPVGWAIENYAAVQIPPVSFTGGSNLVVWRHTRHERAAVELVKFLNSHDAQLKAAGSLEALPARKSALESEQYMQRPLQAGFNQALQSGRAYPPMPLWGLTEDRLVHALQQVWQSYYENPAQDKLALLHERLDPLAQRLAVTLGQYKSGPGGR